LFPRFFYLVPSSTVQRSIFSMVIITMLKIDLFGLYSNPDHKRERFFARRRIRRHVELCASRLRGVEVAVVRYVTS
jgi:hypothetical protein